MNEQALNHLREPRYQKLFRAVRHRLERAGDAPVHSVTLHDLSPDECQAIADLHGWKTVRLSPLKISVSSLDQALRSSRFNAGLRELLEALGGKLRNLPSERETASKTHEELVAEARSHRAILERPEPYRHRLSLWLDDMKNKSAIVRASRGEPFDAKTLLMAALDVVARLPNDQGILLPVLAANATGDPHALDVGAPLGALVQRALVRMLDWSTFPATANDRRRLWAEVGVACDPLSCDVLVMGLRPEMSAESSLLEKQLYDMAEAGEPRRITLRELASSKIQIPTGTEVFVCENPGIVAHAADTLGDRSAPIICTEGIPSTATLQLLTKLSSVGGLLRVRADFDWTGIRIVNQLRRHTPTVPWRYSANDYAQAIDTLSSGLELSGTKVVATWDTQLTELMVEKNHAVFEEQLAPILLEDLSIK